MKDNGILFFIANSIIYILMCVLSALIIFNFIENIFAKIITFLIVILVCGYVEEKLVSVYINEFVENIICKGTMK